MITGIAVLLAGCSSDEITTGGGLEASPISDEWDIKPGDPVAFTLLPSVKAQTRTIGPDTEFVGDYDDIENGYELAIEMFGESSGSMGSAVYSVTDGALVPKTSGSQLYWPDNTKKYGFKATAGTTTLEIDQSNATNLRNQDRLEGYAFVPLKDGGDPLYDENNLNYMKSKEWKAANVTFGEEGDNQKKIPLYLKHKRSKITIILNAGTNVTASDLASASVTIYSYPGPTKVNNPLHTTVDGDPHYTAIVEPYNYQTGDKIIAQITLKGSGSEPDKIFTYKPSNDPSEDKSAYNLAVDNAGNAGKHLTITITLTTN